jgi:predicted dehydrogenase
VRYAVVGLGYISQVAVLPAFQHARENSELVALVSGDATKRAQLVKKYKVNNTYSYEQFSECLESGLIDALYIALPTICIAPIPKALPEPECTCFARSPWP